MPGDEIETHYCQYVEEVLNHHHLDRLAGYLSPDVVVHAPTHGDWYPSRCVPGPGPTGQRISVCAFEGWRLCDGRCAEHWLQLDTGELAPVGAARARRRLPAPRRSR
ncbi:MAG TPA: hypothetical protein VGL99_05000 [Chloroflexota bacterium]